jgi:tetratricopeptide (TPR) repeat protein/DNA-binding CsgD family transcriptional regulator
MNIKGFILFIFLVLIVRPGWALRNYTANQLEVRIYSHPETVGKDIYRFLYIAKKKKQLPEIGEGYYLLGAYESSRLNLLQAAKAYKKSQAIFQRTGNEKWENKANKGIGNMYIKLQNFDKADFFCHKNLEYQLRNGTEKEKGDAYLELATAKYCAGANDSAAFYFNKSAAIFTREKDYASLAETYILNIYIFQADNKDKRIALTYAYKALDAAFRCKDKVNVHIAYSALGELYMKMGNIDSAKHYIHLALDLAHEIHSPGIEGELCKMMSEIYEKQDSVELAHIYLNRSMQTIDTIYTPNKVNHINNIRFDTGEDSAKIKIWYIMPTAILLIFGFVIYYRCKSSGKPQLPNSESPSSLEDEVSRQQKELISKTMQIQQQSKLLEWTLSELNRLRLGDKDKGSVGDLVSDLSSSGQRSNWGEFEMYFNEVHHDFFKKLISDYPHLTANERRLCGFISMNLSNKEISEIIRKSVRSIEVAKYRLTQKLEISKDGSLKATLAKYL